MEEGAPEGPQSFLRGTEGLGLEGQGENYCSACPRLGGREAEGRDLGDCVGAGGDRRVAETLITGNWMGGKRQDGEAFFFWALAHPPTPFPNPASTPPLHCRMGLSEVPGSTPPGPNDPRCSGWSCAPLSSSLSLPTSPSQACKEAK